ncbi:hypothetical protein [Chthonobacter rhizosphaerae]|uniref:hypothetical protein n=1 Tax=Chthonobacter rhizosphaerae TaxID=2735553 RepID=UPI0015EEE11D|nr:hypothetical protein [Chthonobacter rhizosphaerae]
MRRRPTSFARAAIATAVLMLAATAASVAPAQQGVLPPPPAQEGAPPPGQEGMPPPPAQVTPMPQEVAPGGAPASPPGEPGAAEGAGITGGDVQADAPNQPAPQGTRAPRAETSANTGGELYPLLARVRAAPPAIDGRPQPRPNPLASEPAKEMEPDPRGNPDHLFPENYVE